MNARVEYLLSLVIKALLEERMPSAASVIQTLQGAMESKNSSDLQMLLGLVEAYDNSPHMTMKDVEEFSKLMEGKAT